MPRKKKELTIEVVEKVPVYKDKAIDKDVSVKTEAPAKLVRKKTNAKKAKESKVVTVPEIITVVEHPVLTKPEAPLVNWYYVTLGLIGTVIAGLLFYQASVVTGYINSFY